MPRRPFAHRRGLRRLDWAAVMFVVVCGGALSTFALSTTPWRPGQPNAAPLRHDPASPGRDEGKPLRLWVDTDAACGTGWRRAPDDCLAVLALASTPGVTIVGISTTHGNGPLHETDAVMRELAAQLPRQGIASPPVHQGCDMAITDCLAIGSGAGAMVALIKAASNRPLTYLALGPLTNLGAALRLDPNLADRIERVVAVMGRQPGHRFHPAQGHSRVGLMFGHGPVFNDFNADSDLAAVAEVLRAGVSLHLVPYAAGRQWLYTERDLAALSLQGQASQWVAERSTAWLGFWKRVVGLDGFHPFDLVAADYLLRPERHRCARVDAWVAKDPRLVFLNGKRSLIVAQNHGRPEMPPDGTALYCDRFDIEPDSEPGIDSEIRQAKS